MSNDVYNFMGKAFAIHSLTKNIKRGVMSGNNIHQSVFKTTSVAYSEKVAKERGWKIAPRDHPIYSEGSIIIFFNLRPKQSQENVRCKTLSNSKITTDKFK